MESAVRARYVLNKYIFILETGENLSYNGEIYYLVLILTLFFGAQMASNFKIKN